jgi:predicted GIY-YIG superfamily endonuclease
MSKEPAIYIMASQRNGTLYTGVTGYLAQRVWQHKQAATPGFTQRYGCRTLVYYEVLPTMLEAIAREKQIKAGSRRAKLSLVEGMNPLWRDLYDDLV